MDPKADPAPLPRDNSISQWKFNTMAELGLFPKNFSSDRCIKPQASQWYDEFETLQLISGLFLLDLALFFPTRSTWLGQMLATRACWERSRLEDDRPEAMESLSIYKRWVFSHVQSTSARTSSPPTTLYRYIPPLTAIKSHQSNLTTSNTPTNLHFITSTISRANFPAVFYLEYVLPICESTKLLMF